MVFRNYAVYANRGVVEDMFPARDNLFYYDLGKTLMDVKKEYVEPETVPTDTTAPSVPDETTAPTDE